MANGHFGPREEALFYRVRDPFSEKLGREYDLRLLTISTKRIVGSKKFGDSYNYLSHSPMIAEEAKALAEMLFKKIYHRMKDERRYIEYLNFILTYESNDTDRYWPPRPEHFAVKLSFWDQDYNRIKPPYVAQVVIVDDETKVFYADEKDVLGEPVVERFTIQ